MAAGLLGIRDVIEGRPKKEEPAIVSEAPTAPHDRIEMVLDPEHPELSVIYVHDPPEDPPEDRRTPETRLTCRTSVDRGVSTTPERHMLGVSWAKTGGYSRRGVRRP